jgi:DNA polymerase-3 subunit alpha
MSMGEYNDNGHEALNNFLSDTMNYCLYQEQILEFLHSFCGYTKGEADIVRRGFAKKTGTEQFLPQIRSGFIKTMNEKYGEDTEKYEQLIESFLKVIEDASDYGFSKNHSHAYSMIGYACAWLRYYYPLEFITSALNIYSDNEEKTSSIVEYAHQRKVKIEPIKFGYSKAKYMLDKESVSIYKGIGSVKYCNDIIGDELYDLKDNQYNTFIDLLYDISKTSCNSKQLDILIRLDFFREYGNSQYLSIIRDNFDFFKQGTAKQIKKEKVDFNEMLGDIVERHSRVTEKSYLDLDTKNILYDIEFYLKKLDLKDFSLKEKILFQQEYLGYIDIQTNNPDDKNKLLATSIMPLKTKDKSKVWGYKIKTIALCSGKNSEITIWARIFDKAPIMEFDTIFVRNDWIDMKKYNGYTNFYVNQYNFC